MQKGGKLDNLFFTSDMLLVAVLRVKGFTLYDWQETVNSAGAKKVQFYFDKTPELKQAVEDFWKIDPLLPAKQLYRELQEVKAIIYGIGT